MFPWGLFPFGQEIKKVLEHINSDDMEAYMKNMMGQMHPSFRHGMVQNENGETSMNSMRYNSPPITSDQQSPSTFHINVFETHEHVFVRIALKDPEWAKQMKIYHSPHQFFIENIPEPGSKYSAVLPAIVKKTGAIASYKDQMLEVKLLKNKNVPVSEIEISDTP